MPHILVVDDYKPLLQDLSQTASGACMAVTTATSAAEAVECIEKMTFDLVITDLFLENQRAEDGLSVVRAAKRHQTTEVIVVTAFGRPELSVESMRLGAFDYLERGSPGTNFRAMLTAKIQLALDFRAAKLAAQN